MKTKNKIWRLFLFDRWWQHANCSFKHTLRPQYWYQGRI